MTFEPHDLYSLINALIGFGCGLWVMKFAFTKANGKKPLRIVSGLIILFFATVYALDVLNVIEVATLGPDIVRPFLPVLYFIPVWESMSDPVHEKKDSDDKRGGNE